MTALITFILTYKFKSKVQLINLALLVFLCIFYSFSYYYIENIEFSLFLSIVLYVFSMHGNYVRFIILTISIFLPIIISLVNASFKN